LWPAQNHNAIIWLLCHEVYFSLRKHPTLGLQVYIDFLWRAWWGPYQLSKRKKVYGKYLDVIDWTGFVKY
jgi:hypothetical protein